MVLYVKLIKPINYIEPNKIIIKGTTFLAFNHGRDVYVENLQKHINISDLDITFPSNFLVIS